MKRRMLAGLIGIGLLVCGAGGCTDGVRQAVVPGLISGFSTITDGIITGNDNLNSGTQQIAEALFAGLRHALYPEG